MAKRWMEALRVENVTRRERAEHYRQLMERGIIVRWLPGQGLAQGLRMTIGTETETRALADALREIVSAQR